MGGKTSKNHSDTQHLEEPQATENLEDVERRKLAKNTIQDRKKCNTYLPYQEMPKQASKLDPSKTDVPDGDNLPCETVDPDSNKAVNESGSIHLYANISFPGTGRESQQATTYENVEVHRDYSGAKGSSVYPDHLDAAADISIRRYYRELKNRISVKEVCDHLIQNKVLGQIDWEDIKSIDQQLRSADKLLQIILRKNQSAYEVFLNALRSTDLKDLADKLQRPAPTMTERPWMRAWDENVIFKVWPKIEAFLMKELLPQYIIDFFMQENIFSVDEYETIFKCCGERVKMVKKLVDAIYLKLPSSLFVLVYALEEIDNEKEENKGSVNFIAKELETIIRDGSSLENIPKSDGEEKIIITVRNKMEPEESWTAKAPLSRYGRFTLKIDLRKYGQPLDTGAIEIFINTAGIGNTVQLSLEKSTDCKFTSAEHGCVIVHLWPKSKEAYQKLTEFCKKDEIQTFVMDLLREKDIISSIPEGELSIDLKVNYYEEAEETEETREPQKNLIQLIKDNRSFLREKTDVQTLITESLENKMLKKLFNDLEITQLKRLLEKNRIEAADFFLTCLLDKDPKKTQSYINILSVKTKTKIFERLQKSESMYRNSQAIKENIIKHFELIADEIDPCQFEDIFMDREILNKTFFKDLRKRHSRRRAQAASFLEAVLRKGGRAVFALVDVLREMGCGELVEKLTTSTFNAKLSKPTQQRKARICQNERMDYVNVEVYHGTTPEVLMWSCCMTIIVEKKQKDEKNTAASDISNTDKEKIYENWQNEEPAYENFVAPEADEGIGEDVVLRLNAELSQIDRPVTQPEPSFTSESEDKSVKVFTFPLRRGPDREKQSIRTQINLASKYENDSAIDVRL
ncbi:hypothetical protein CHS0354_037322 [Potamilus streckersoni]|uniref:CARD domain-containing protein n=1 Tax=Potamilus streckersoni TaxID=2493646 RepID=A0AAE0TK52_9BIVA|nr:hypothetical protein CHS0354_037322 [Potamilus streckersoni]